MPALEGRRYEKKFEEGAGKTPPLQDAMRGAGLNARAY